MWKDVNKWLFGVACAPEFSHNVSFLYILEEELIFV